jgi:hypothetical protein
MERGTLNVSYLHELEAWRAAREFEAWIAWRLDTRTWRIRDLRELSPPVLDAWDGRP